jgi:hypothetical protein
MGAELFHADGRTDGQTDMTKLIVAFLNFAKALKNHRYFEIFLAPPMYFEGTPF